MVDIKKIKAEILRTAGKEEPPKSFVDQEGIMDMMLKEYFNPASRAPQEMTLNALTAAAGLSKGNAEITEQQVKAILDKYAP